MFWDRLIPSKYLVKSEIVAVKVFFTEQATAWYYTRLLNKNNKLEVAATGICNGLSELPANILKNKIPLLLIINGKGVILKKITLSEETQLSTEEIIRQNLPAINPSDFFIQVYKQDNGSAFLSLCRKEQVNELLVQFKKNKYELAGINIGTPSIIGLQPLWANYNVLRANLHTIELSNNAIDIIKPLVLSEADNTPLSFDTVKIEAPYLLAFASGLAYFMQRKIWSSDNLELTTLPLKHTEKNKFRLLLIASVAIAFVIAVTNVIAYTTYFDKNNQLESELTVYQGKYEKINQLLTEYQKNKDLIENAGVLNKNKLSEYADRIGQTLPDDVVLSDLYFNPKKENDNSEDSLVTFESNHITLKGNCNKSLIVNEWVNVLKMQKFVKDVSLEKFIYNNDGIIPNFEIKLLTN
jgi:Tfp pilus assembly protein PilN